MGRAVSALIEPDDSVEVQVVSGLIQHQQCGFHEECPGEEWSQGQERKASVQQTQSPWLENYVRIFIR